MSALGHKRTLKHVRLMSALPPKADIETQSCAKSRHLFPSPMLCKAPGSFVASSGARCTWRAASSASSWDCPRLHWQQTFPLQPFASQLTGTADRFRLLAGSPVGRFFVVAPDLHFAEDALEVPLLCWRPQGLVDVGVADENLQMRNSPLGGTSENVVPRPKTIST